MDGLKVLNGIYQLNCLVGFAKSYWSDRDENLMTEIQNVLFKAQSKIARINEEINIEPQEASLRNFSAFLAKKTKEMEIEGCLPELNNFIIPEGNNLSALMFFLSSFTRGILLDIDSLSDNFEYLTEFLERLSYFFFVYARYLNFLDGEEERRPNAINLISGPKITNKKAEKIESARP